MAEPWEMSECEHRPHCPNVPYSATIALLRRLGLFLRPNFLDQQECAKIRGEMDRGGGELARVVRYGTGLIDETVRRTRVMNISPQTSSTVKRRLEKLRLAVGKHYGVRLTGCDTPQFLMYRRGSYFKPHTDNTEDSRDPLAVRRRRLSVVVFLNEQAAIVKQRAPGFPYRGGTLYFYRLPDRPTWQTFRLPLLGKTGFLVVFPSAIEHEVSTVECGTRYSAVSWFY